MVLITIFLLSVLRLLKNIDMAIGTQPYAIDVVILLVHEALLAPFRTSMPPHCKHICLVNLS